MPPTVMMTAVDQGNPADGELHFLRAFLVEGFFQPGQRGAGPGNATVAGFQVLLKRQTACKTARETAAVELVQEAAVIAAVDPQPGSIFVGEGPADVVVAAHVVDPGSPGVQPEAGRQRLGQQADLAGRQRVPEQGHQQRVVRKLAFLRGDVFDDFVGMHDRFGFEQQRRGGDARDRVEGLDERVRFRQVFATCAQLLPDESNRIQRGRSPLPGWRGTSISSAIRLKTAGLA